MIAAAQRYADRGFPVFPCKETSDKSAGSKAPYLPGESTSGAHDGGHWLASIDQEKIAAWWRRWPRALVGLPTGLRSQSVVIDLDPKEFALKEMARALRLWCGGDIRGSCRDDGEFILPAVAVTQSGGLHLFYRYPDDATLKALGVSYVGNRANLFRRFIEHGEAKAELAHVDVRGEGGYVIAAPSRMENGARYAWLWAPSVLSPGVFRLPDLPTALIDIVCGLRTPRAEEAAERQRAQEAGRFAAREISDERVRKYVERAISGALAVAEGAAAGNRNAAVYWAATRLSAFVRGGTISRGEAESLLLGHLPAGVAPSEKKIRGTVKSGLDSDFVPAFSPAQLGQRRA